MIKNKYVLNVDIKRKHTAVVPTFVQHDTATLVFKVFDNGKPFSLKDVTRVEVSHKRKDGKVVIGLATYGTVNNESIITYDYMGNEMSKEGFVDTSVTIFATNTRVSIQPFKVSIIADIRNSVGSTEEFGVLQELVMRAENVISDTIEATNYAIEQGDKAKIASNLAENNANFVITNEDGRIASETERKTYENSRKSNESARVIEEGIRKTAEGLRNTSESSRNSSEQARVSSENTRVSQENSRKLAEGARVSQEETRQSDFTSSINASNLATTQTKDVKDATNLVKEATESTRLATEQVKNETNTVKDNTETVRLATEQERLATETVKNDTLTVKNETVTAKNDAIQATLNTQQVADSWRYDNEYSISNAYKKNNVVSMNGSSYIAIEDNTGIAPTGDSNDPNWRIIARKGIDGDGAVVLYKDTFTSTKNQRVFTLSNEYDPLQTRLRVIVGGSEQFSPENFMETSKNSFTLNYDVPEDEDVVAVYFGQAPAIVNDLQAQISGMNTIVQRVDTGLESKVNIPDTSESFISTANQSTFTLKNGTYATGRGSLKVIVGGVEQYPILNFTETSNKIFTLSESLKAGINVNVLYMKI